MVSGSGFKIFQLNNILNGREDEMKVVQFQKLVKSDEYLFSLVWASLKYFIRWSLKIASNCICHPAVHLWNIPWLDADPKFST